MMLVFLSGVCTVGIYGAIGCLKIIRRNFMFPLELTAWKVTSLMELKLFPLDDDNASFYASYLILWYYVSMQIAKAKAFQILRI